MKFFHLLAAYITTKCWHQPLVNFKWELVSHLLCMKSAFDVYTSQLSLQEMHIPTWSAQLMHQIDTGLAAFRGRLFNWTTLLILEGSCKLFPGSFRRGAASGRGFGGVRPKWTRVNLLKRRVGCSMVHPFWLLRGETPIARDTLQPMQCVVCRLSCLHGHYLVF